MAKIQFSDTSVNGLVELLARATGTQSATSSSYPLKQKTVDINSTLDYFFYLAKKYANKQKVDDTGNTTEPIYAQNLVSGTQTYTFTTDSGSNKINAVDRVEILRADGTSKRLTQLNPESVNVGLPAYKSTAGEPEEYRIVGKTITLYPKPGYNSTNGLVLYTERDGIYFASTDTAVYAGIPNNFHDYLWIRPASIWAAIKKLPQAKDLLGMKLEMEEAIKDHYSRLNKDSGRMRGSQRLTPYVHDTK